MYAPEILLPLINLPVLKNLSKNLKNFGGSENQLFDAITYGAMFHKSNGEIIDKNKIIQVLGKDFYHDLLEIKDEIKLNRILFGYFDRCFVANQVLSKHNYFLKFFERRDMFRFLIQKKTQGKNEVTRNLSNSVVEKFNGYEMIRQNF